MTAWHWGSRSGWRSRHCSQRFGKIALVWNNFDTVVDDIDAFSTTMTLTSLTSSDFLNAIALSDMDGDNDIDIVAAASTGLEIFTNGGFAIQARSVHSARHGSKQTTTLMTWLSAMSTATKARSGCDTQQRSRTHESRLRDAQPDDMHRWYGNI